MKQDTNHARTQPTFPARVWWKSPFLYPCANSSLLPFVRFTLALTLARMQPTLSALVRFTLAFCNLFFARGAPPGWVGERRQVFGFLLAGCGNVSGLGWLRGAKGRGGPYAFFLLPYTFASILLPECNRQLARPRHGMGESFLNYDQQVELWR